MSYVGGANDPATILADSDAFYSAYFANSDEDVVEPINAITPYQGLQSWDLGQRTSALGSDVRPRGVGKYNKERHHWEQTIRRKRSFRMSAPAGF